MELRTGKLTRQLPSIDNSAAAATTSIYFGEKMPQPKHTTNETLIAAQQLLSSTEKAIKMELETILRKPAHTAEEK